MKRFFKRLLSKLPKRVVAGAIVGLAIALPVAASAAQTVNIAATTGVANVTNGDTAYASSVNATYNQVVKIEVTYTNTEAPSSGLVANNVNVKINVPTTPGTNQVVTTTTGGDNTNQVNGQATVVLNRADAFLQYIPGSAQANITNTDGSIHLTPISDDVALGSGYIINNGNPCQSAAVAVEARVMVPGVSITKQVEGLNQSNAWAASNTASPGDTLKYLITYQNTGNTVQNQVIIRDILPAGMTLVPGTTMVADVSHPNGIQMSTDDVTQGGLNLGDFGPTANAFVTFQVKVPTADQLTCGQNEFRNIGVAQPQGFGAYTGTALTTVTKTCTNTPVFACSAFDAVAGANRTVTVTNFATTQSGGATFKNVILSWGDSSTALTTDATNIINQTHQYTTDGGYTLTAVAHFTVNGQDVSAAGCTKTVSFSTPGTPTTPNATPPTQLVNTGPGSVVGLFAGITVAGAVLYRLFLSRRLVRD